MTLRPPLILILFSFFPLFFYCVNDNTSPISKDLENYFLYPKKHLFKKLKRTLKTEDNYSILLSTMKSEAPRGAGFVNLQEPKGVNFTVGFNTPDNYSKNKNYPLIIYLHGGIGTTKSDKGKEAWKMFDFIQKEESIFLASPSANREYPWWSKEGIKRIMLSVKYMTLHYPIDSDKIFLAGVSDGGTACYAIADQAGTHFAGFFAISGLGAILQNLGIDLNISNLAQCNIYNVNAGKDRLYPFKYVESFLKTLKNKGVPIKNKLYPDELHGFEYREKETHRLLYLMKRWKRHKQESVNHTFSNSLPYFNTNIGEVTFDKNLKDVPFLNTYIEKDTVHIRHSGISKFQFFYDNKKSRKIHFKSNNKSLPAKKSKAVSLENILFQIQYTVSPIVENRDIYTISLE